jgi:GT2 family glycosyltransferase
MPAGDERKRVLVVSVIIVNYNTVDLTKNCVRSLLDKTDNVKFDISVVDNASADGSVAELRREFPGINVIESGTNVGFARANNIAIRQSTADYVFVLNSDTLLVNNALKVLAEFMEREENRDVACCGGCLYDKDMLPVAAYGNFPTLAEIAFKVSKLKTVFPGYYRQRLRASGEYTSAYPGRVDYVVGADMFIRKSVLDEVGMFDEDFFLYFEETELSFRMAKNGYRSMIVPEAKVIHLAGRSSTNASKMKTATLRERSRFLFFRKSYGKGVARLAKALYMIHYGRRLLLGFRRRDREMLAIIWKA